MSTQHNEMVAKAAEIREKMNEQLTKAKNYRQKKDDLTEGILPAVEEKINENSEKTAGIVHVKEIIESSIPLIANETKPMPDILMPGSPKPVRRRPRIF